MEGGADYLTGIRTKGGEGRGFSVGGTELPVGHVGLYAGGEGARSGGSDGGNDGIQGAGTHGKGVCYLFEGASAIGTMGRGSAGSGGSEEE